MAEGRGNDPPQLSLCLGVQTPFVPCTVPSILDGVERIELSSSDSKSGVLPLDDTPICMAEGRRIERLLDLCPDYGLATRYITSLSTFRMLENWVGLEPTVEGFPSAD